MIWVSAHAATNSLGYQILLPIFMYLGPLFCERQSASVVVERSKFDASASGDINSSRKNLIWHSDFRVRIAI